MNSKESALHDAILQVLNQFDNYFYGSIPLCDVTVREVNLHDCRCYVDKSMMAPPLPPESLEQAKYSIVTEIDGMIDFSCNAGDVPYGSQHFIVRYVSFEISHEYKNLRDYFHAVVLNDKIDIQFNL